MADGQLEFWPGHIPPVLAYNPWLAVSIPAPLDLIVKYKEEGLSDVQVTQPIKNDVLDGACGKAV